MEARPWIRFVSNLSAVSIAVAVPASPSTSCARCTAFSRNNRTVQTNRRTPESSPVRWLMRWHASRTRGRFPGGIKAKSLALRLGVAIAPALAGLGLVGLRLLGLLGLVRLLSFRRALAAATRDSRGSVDGVCAEFAEDVGFHSSSVYWFYSFRCVLCLNLYLPSVKRFFADLKSFSVPESNGARVIPLRPLAFAGPIEESAGENR